MTLTGRTRQRLLVDRDTFLARLSEEIERAERYDHSFTMLLLQAPEEAVGRNRVGTLFRVAMAARSLVRGCDLVTVFESPGLFAVLLPETGPSGAARVLERFQANIVDESGAWDVRLAVYPHDRENIEAFLQKAA